MGSVLKKSYFEELCKSMTLIAKNKNSLFLGQSVVYPGNLIYKTLSHIPSKKKMEMPVFEDTQMGLSIGLALNGILPISCFPRFDFMLLAFNQLINHLDKIPLITDGKFKPKVIIRVMVGSKIPLDAGEQHTQDYFKPLKQILKTIDIYQLKTVEDIYLTYQKVIKSKNSSIVVEYSKYI